MAEIHTVPRGRIKQLWQGGASRKMGRGSLRWGGGGREDAKNTGSGSIRGGCGPIRRTPKSQPPKSAERKDQSAGRRRADRNEQHRMGRRRVQYQIFWGGVKEKGVTQRSTRGRVKAEKKNCVSDRKQNGMVVVSREAGKEGEEWRVEGGRRRHGLP